MYFHKNFFKYILIIIIIILIYKFLKEECNIENLTLTEYTTVYSDAIKKKIDTLILNSQFLVTTLNSNTTTTNTNVINSISTINSSATTTTINDISINKTVLNTKVADIQNTILGENRSSTALSDNQALMTKFNSNINISGFSYILKSKIDPVYAFINTKLIPEKKVEDKLYIISYLSSENFSTFISNLNTLVSDAKNNQNKINDLLPSIVSIQNALLKIKTSIDNLKITSLNTKSSCENSVIYSNTNDINIIAKALGDVFLNAQKNVDDTLKIKNQAILDTQNAITRKISDAELQLYKNLEKIATDNYDKSFQYLNFLTNPDLALTNLNEVSEIINAKNTMDKVDKLNNMITYFIINTENSQKKILLSNLLTAKNDSKISYTSTINNINSMFSTNIKKNKDDSIIFANNILIKCNEIIATINSLETTNNTNLTNINNVVNSANEVLNNSTTSISTIQSQITNFSTSSQIIKNNLEKVLAYKVQILNYISVYNNWYNSSQPYFLGYSKSKGQLKKIYFFVNIYSWNTCTSTETYFRIIVKNEKINSIIYDKIINITNSPYMTLEVLDELNLYIDQYCSVSFAIAGSYYLSCSVESSNLQIQLNIDTYQQFQAPIMYETYKSNISEKWQCISSSSSGKYMIGFVITNSSTSNLYNSSDFGKTWKLKYILNDDGGYNCAISESGKYQIGTDFRSSSVIISKDYGVTFSKINTAINPWGVCISYTGQYISIISGNNNWGGNSGPLYLSNDYGTTWTEKNIGNVVNGSISMSSDGKYQTVVSTATIYKSTDYGSTFNTYQPLNFRTSGYGNQVSVSETGQYQLISTQNSSTYGLWYSIDYGNTWVGRNIYSSLNNFESVCMSPNYQYQCVSCINNPNFNLYISKDYGNTWNGFKTPNPCIYLTISNSYIYGVCKNNIIYSFSI